MNNNQTIEKMRQMRMKAMAELHQNHLKSNQYQQMSTDDYLALLVDHEWENRQNQKIDRLTKAAKFRQKTSLEEVDYLSQRNLDKNMFIRLGTLDFITRKQNIIITGASGTGKSFLAQALGHQACSMGFKTAYETTARLMKRLKLAKADGTYLLQLNKLLTQVSVVILAKAFKNFEKNFSDFKTRVISSWISLLIASEISNNSS